jgi:protein involved in polysaccharide export with SLBB domain
MRRIVGALCVVAMFGGCRTGPMPNGTLQTGDTLRVLIVTMHGRSDTRTCVVDELGHISLPFIGAIRAADSTPAELDAAALKMYQDAALHIESVSTELEQETHNKPGGR